MPSCVEASRGPDKRAYLGAERLGNPNKFFIPHILVILFFFLMFLVLKCQKSYCAAFPCTQKNRSEGNRERPGTKGQPSPPKQFQRLFKFSFLRAKKSLEEWFSTERVAFQMQREGLGNWWPLILCLWEKMMDFRPDKWYTANLWWMEISGV